MGSEYKIRFAVPSDFSEEILSKRLPKADIPGSNWVEYSYRVDVDGFYFVDHGGRRDISSIAFRCLVDEALRHGERVAIEKPE
jgi:hypothetical protein